MLETGVSRFIDVKVLGPKRIRELHYFSKRVTNGNVIRRVNCLYPPPRFFSQKSKNLMLAVEVDPIESGSWISIKLFRVPTRSNIFFGPIRPTEIKYDTDKDKLIHRYLSGELNGIVADIMTEAKTGKSDWREVPENG